MYEQLKIANTIAAGPGPGNTDPRVLQQFANAGLADHMHPDVLNGMIECKHMLRAVWGTENTYTFGLSYNNENFMVNSKNDYILNKLNQELFILNKNELKFFYNLFNHLKEDFFKQHHKWFEEKFEETVFNSIFYNYLYPNIEENCVNLKCLVDENVLEKINDDNAKVVPTFHIKSITFENNRLTTNIHITDVFIKDNILENADNQKSLEENVEENLEKNVNFPEKKTENLEQNNINENNDKEVNTQDDNESIEEVYFDGSNLEKTTLNITDEDHFIIYKILNSNIKNNLLKELNNILLNKGVKSNNINLSDIIYDSDEESDDLEDDDSFEENFNTLV